MKATVVAAVLCVMPAMVSAQGAPIESRLTRLEQKLDNQGLLDLLTQIEQLQQEVRRLRGDLENQTFTIEQLRKGQTEIYNNLDQRIGAFEQGATGGLAPAVAAGAAPSPSGSGIEPPLSTLAAPGSVAVAGQPADQSMAVAVQSAGNAVTDMAQDAAHTTLDAIPGNADPLPPGASIGEAVTAAVDPNATLQPPTTPGNVNVVPGAGATLAPAVNDGGIQPAAAAAGQTLPSIVPTLPSRDTPESEAAYRAAFAMLKEGQYEESISAFNTFLQQHPGSQYSDNAQYWLGEAYYVMRQFEPAIEQYQRLVQNYPQSQKQSHALLKIAYSYSELGLDDQAVGVLKDLKVRFPGSAAARLADERMQRIRAQKP